MAKQLSLEAKKKKSSTEKNIRFVTQGLEGDSWKSSSGGQTHCFGLFSALEIGDFSLAGTLALPAAWFPCCVFRRESNPLKMDLISPRSCASPRGQSPSKQKLVAVGCRFNSLPKGILRHTERPLQPILSFTLVQGSKFLKFPQVPHKETPSTHSRREINQ